MSVQVPSSLFTLKKTERLLQEQRLGGHWVPTPEGRAGGGGSGMFPRTGFREGTLAKARSPRLSLLQSRIHSWCWKMLPRVRRGWKRQLQSQAHVGDQRKIVPGPEDESRKDKPLFLQGKKEAPFSPFKLGENRIRMKRLCFWNRGQKLVGKVWLHQELP